MTIQQHASFDSSAAELNATSKLVKAWESKNAKNAAKAGGISLMALSLAACGGSSTPVADAPAADPVVPVVPVVDAAKTLQLTTRSDDLTGGSGADTFDGQTAGELNGTDSFDGGAGTDTLDVTIAATQPAPTISNIENVIIQSTADAADLDFDNADTSITTITVTTSATDLDLLNMQNNATFKLIDVTSDAAGLTLDFDTDALGSATSVLTMSLDGSTVAVDTVQTGLTDDFTSAVLSTSGTASALTLDMTDYTSLTLSGTAALELISTNGFTELATITGTGSAGLTIDLDDNPLAYTISLGSGADTVVADQANTGTGGRSIDMGAGNDTLDLAGLGSEADDVYDGGAGTDTLKTSDVSDFTAANLAGVTGFERITVLEHNISLDMAVFPSSNSISIIEVENDGTGSTASEFTNVGDGVTTLELFGDTATDGSADAGEDIILTRKVDGTANTLTIRTTGTDAGVAAGVQIGDEVIVDNEETITIDSSMGSLTLNTGLSSDDATSITIIGDEAVDLSAVTGTALAKIDASGMTSTAALTISSVASTANMTVTGGATNYTGIVTITTGTGNDTITTTGGADVIDGGNGNDTITTGAGTDNITGGAGNDVISSGTGNDDITPGAGTDTVTTGTGNDTVNFVAGADGATALANGVTTITDFEAGADDDIIEVNLDSLGATGVETIQETSVQLTTTSDATGDLEVIVYTGNQSIDTSGTNAQDLAAINAALFDADAIAASNDGVVVFSADTDGDGTGEEVQVWVFGETDGTDGNADFAYQIATLSNIDATSDLAGVFHVDNFELM